MADTLQVAADFQLHSMEVLLFSFGMYSWEFLVSLWFEYNLCLRRLPFKWPLIPYFIARYGALIGMIANLTLAFGTTPVNCHALYESALVLGNSAIAASSCNLMVRAIIIWMYRWYIVIPLTLVAIGQWILFAVGFRNSGSSWSPEAATCVGGNLDPRYVGAFGVYTAGFELIIVIVSLTGLKLVKGSPSFTSVLRTQGIAYFVLVLAVHSVMAVFAFVVPDSAYSSFSGVAALSIGPAVSCRMVRSILKTSVESDTYSRGWRPDSSGPTEAGDDEMILSTRINLDPYSRTASSPIPIDPRKHSQNTPAEDLTTVLGAKGLPRNIV